MQTNVNENQKNTVSGYVRNAQLLFPKRITYFNIPPLVTHAILSFYTPPFGDMNLREELLRGIYSYSWQTPFAAQRRGITPIIQKTDTIIQGEKGSGKSGAYAIAALQRLNVKECQCQILVLAPTRELVRQILSMFNALGAYLGATTRACIARGVHVREDMRHLSYGVQIVVSTPEKINNIMSRRGLVLDALTLFVLDGMDQMMARGFKHEIYECFRYFPYGVCVALCSEIMTDETLQLSERFTRNPRHIVINQPDLDRVKPYYIAVEKEDYKFEALRDLFEVLSTTKAIVYVNTQRKATWLTDKMRDLKLDLTVSNMAANEGELMMRGGFRNDSGRVLITNDSSRSDRDFNQVSLVINYDLPTNREEYGCRVGWCTIRKRIAINFVCDEEEPMLREIELFFGTKIDALPMEFGSIMD